MFLLGSVWLVEFVFTSTNPFILNVIFSLIGKLSTSFVENWKTSKKSKNTIRMVGKHLVSDNVLQQVPRRARGGEDVPDLGHCALYKSTL